MNVSAWLSLDACLSSIEASISRSRVRVQCVAALCLVGTVLLSIGDAYAGTDPRLAGTGHLRLVDDLDRPHDGYCLDLMGSGDHVRFDMPLTAHNCKPGLYHDEAVIMEPTGHIRFPTYNACATVAGLNGKPLPGVAVMPRRCNERSAFLNAAPLQMFTFHEDGRIELNGSNLCLAVGHRSESTFDPTHRYRALFMADCASADPKLSRWRFIVPKH